MRRSSSPRRAAGLLGVGLLGLLGLLGLVAPLAPVAAAPLPTATAVTLPAGVRVHTLEVTGTGVGSYPAFDPAIERYAVTTTAATGGTLTVHATTRDPAGLIRVDGRVAPDGTATVTGLSPGDEVSVLIQDSAGTEVHSLFYLPPGFPALEATGSGADLAPLQVGMTLFRFLTNDPRFATVVDRNGVPIHVERYNNSLDLKQQSDGTITIAEPTTVPGRSGYEISVRDDQWHETARRQVADPLTDTDGHDSVLLPDGRAFLVSYEPNPGNHTTDAVIQEVDADGQELWRWSSEGLEDESVTSPPASGLWDYAHINSIQVLPDGDVVASFRHLSSVLRIASLAHDGYQPGDIVWRFGGRHSDFTFPDDPEGGPCAQHTATVLPNGHLLVFDDGSGGFFAGPMCVDQSDPLGPTHTREQSRAAEWALDPASGAATLVWEYGPPDWYTWFMGSAYRLDDGHTLIGWADEPSALASEVAADDSLMWQLRVAPTDPPTQHYFSYRAAPMDVPDAFAPELSVAVPAEGADYDYGQRVVPDLTCTDVGGSSLQSCGLGDAGSFGPLDTSTPGPHTYVARATDGAGNTTEVIRHYTVGAPPPAPPAPAVSHQPRWTDDRVERTLRGARVRTTVRLANAGTGADSFLVRGAAGNAAFDVRYEVGGRNVTRAVLAGTLRTSVLAPGQAFTLTVVVARTDRTRPGAHRSFTLRATSAADPASGAAVRVVVQARGHPARARASTSDGPYQVSSRPDTNRTSVLGNASGPSSAVKA